MDIILHIFIVAMLVVNINLGYELNATKFNQNNLDIRVNVNLTAHNKTHYDINSEEKLNPLNSMVCDRNNDCIVDYDKHRICADSVCQCYPDYKWDQTSDMCQHSTCFNEKDCQTYDMKRECDRNGFCVCKKGYAEDEYNKVCVTSMISQLWFSIQISVSIFICNHVEIMLILFE